MQLRKINIKNHTIGRRLKILIEIENLFGKDNLAGLEEILRASDLNNCNEEGECFVHIASGMGQLDVLKFLHFKGADLSQVDGNGENGIHWAARKGHCDVIEFLHQQGLPVNCANKTGDTPLHLASKQGHAKAVELLCRHHDDVNRQNDEGETALHLASVRGHIESVRCLIAAGANPNITDNHGCTALHLALRRHHVSIAIMLLQDGCNIDIVDNLGEAPIHIAAREGLLPMAQTLCAFGCKVEIPNKAGQYPLHLAARNGHTELVRCLCLAGCDVELKNKDGITAEITALAQGYNKMADLLNNLRNVHLKEEYISQLIPSTRPIPKIKIKLFGHSGVGKSTFVESIKCGYFTSWFRRSVGSMSPKATRSKKLSGDYAKSSIELNSSGPKESELSFDTNFETYTKGIDVQQVSISGIGEISIWEFSGHEPYYMMYDNFIGNTNCIHLLFFRLNDSYEVQLQQVHFWLAFLLSRIPPQEPLGYCGKSGKPARVALVATHADTASCHRVAATGEYVSSEATSILRTTRQKFGQMVDLHETVFVLDAHVVGSPAMKALKSYVAFNKEKVTQGLPKSTGFLEAVCLQLPSWRKSHTSFPAMCWNEFIELVHSDVNSLAGEEHMKELIQQLQIMGEVVYVACETNDIVVLDPTWLCGPILGYLLSQENLDRARFTGIYSADDVQLLFPEADGQKLLLVLEALQLCTECESEGDIEYEFPCFNLVETLKGLWEPAPSQYTAYGGVRLFSKHKHLLGSLFSRLQVHLRRSSKEHADPECDLYQWCRGSKFCSGLLEGLITLDDKGTAFEVKVRGPTSMRSECFFFQEDLISVIEQMLFDVCPGLLIERHILSSSQLQAHSKQVFSYSPVLIMRVLLRDGVYGTVINEQTNAKETLLSLLFFGTPEVLTSNQQHEHLETLNTQIRVPFSSSIFPHSQTSPLLQRQNQLPHTTAGRRRSLPQQQTSLPRSMSQSSASQLLQNRCSNFQVLRSDSSPALLQDQNPVVSLVSDLHASQLPLLCCQCLCAILDPQESMGRDWCMLGVLLGMTDKLPKLDPGDNPAFSPTACILGEWLKRPDSTVGQLLMKLEELERNDAVEALMSTLPLFRITPSGFQDLKDIESHTIHEQSATSL